ncbi:MAG: methyltransferase domain-containing protein [Campylobacterales bacterium]|nr:methyltransferase domain-containing protein [Campylobacterales bacterium]
MSNGLDLYAKVEDLLGVNEVTPILNDYYFEALDSLEFKSLLDVGCGSGNFLADVGINYPEVEAMGIDLSAVMVERTKARGLKAECIDLCKVEQTFDVITAIFDMMNYLDDKQLKRFMGCIEQRLNKGGYFIFDINTLFAFKEIAAGSHINDGGDRFVTIDSDYYEKEGVYEMMFTLFEKKGEDGCFVKSQAPITQYYRTVEEIRKLTKMKLVSKKPISIYSNKVEKFFLVFKKM